MPAFLRAFFAEYRQGRLKIVSETKQSRDLSHDRQGAVWRRRERNKPLVAQRGEPQNENRPQRLGAGSGSYGDFRLRQSRAVLQAVKHFERGRPLADARGSVHPEESSQHK
jgi:hypothetical protein